MLTKVLKYKYSSTIIFLITKIIIIIIKIIIIIIMLISDGIYVTKCNIKSF